MACSRMPSHGSVAREACGSIDLVRSYDFTNPAQVKETRIEPGSIDNVPERFREALRAVLDVPGTPAEQP